MNNYIKKKIKMHAMKELPNECCGFLYENESGKPNTLECKNTSPSPKWHFKISPVDYLRADSLGKIVGVYHSHTMCGKNKFSNADALNSESQELEYILYDAVADDFNFYEPRNKL